MPGKPAAGKLDTGLPVPAKDIRDAYPRYGARTRRPKPITRPLDEGEDHDGLPVTSFFRCEGISDCCFRASSEVPEMISRTKNIPRVLDRSSTVHQGTKGIFSLWRQEVQVERCQEQDAMVSIKKRDAQQVYQ